MCQSLKEIEGIQGQQGVFLGMLLGRVKEIGN